MRRERVRNAERKRRGGKSRVELDTETKRVENIMSFLSFFFELDVSFEFLFRASAKTESAAKVREMRRRPGRKTGRSRKREEVEKGNVFVSACV
jgi:hypothetical protein